MKCHKHWQPLHGLESNILWPHWLLDFNLLSQCTVISGYICHSLKHISRWNFGRLSRLLRTGALTFFGFFFFLSYLLFEIGHSVWMYNLWPSEYTDLSIPIFIHTCTDINFYQGKPGWNSSKSGVVRHDISFMDMAEKINVWASSLSITTFSYRGTKRHTWQLIPHHSREMLTATPLHRPQFVYTTVLIKPWSPDNFKEEILHDPFSGHACMCLLAYFLFY